MEKNRIKIIIDGNTYNVISDDDELHVLKVAEMVDHHIQDVKSKASHLSPTMIAVLSAMNISDELIKARNLSDEEQRKSSMNDIIQKQKSQIKSQTDALRQNEDIISKSDEKIILYQKDLSQKEEKIQNLESTLLQRTNELKEIEILKSQINKLKLELDKKSEENSEMKIQLEENQSKAIPNDDLIVLQNQLKADRIDFEKQLIEKDELIDELRIEMTQNENQLSFDSVDSSDDTIDLSQLMEIEEELKQSKIALEQYDEKIFYLQRKLTDKEEELQSVKRELEEFIEEFEK